MCYYITATIPKSTVLNRVEPIFASCKLGFDTIENPSIQALIGADRLYFKPTLTDCDCDTTLGGLNTKHAYKPETLAKQAESYRQRGWSETKIKRWLESKQNVKERNEKAELERQQDWLLKESEWRAAITKILNSGLIAEFGLLLHWYTGPLSSKIADLTVQKIKINMTNDSYFHKFPEKTLTFFS